MNEEQSTPEKATEAEQDTSKVFLGDSTLQSGKEFENNKVNDNYYAVDDPKKEISTTIGDGEMRDEGIVGTGNVPEENPLFTEGPVDEQDKAELRDSGN
ncbi:MAG: hypothetical protein WKG06_00760 [Segetibacter sp.]